MSFACQEGLYISKLVDDLKLTTSLSPVIMNVDNQGAMSLAKNKLSNSRSKHIDIRCHFIRDHVTKNELELIYVQSEDNVADLMTKPYSKHKIKKFKYRLFGHY